MPSEVTDPALLAQLEGGQEVTNPSLIAQLEAPQKATPAPPTAPTGSFLENTVRGVPMFFNKLSTGLAQRYASAFEPNISGPLGDMAAKERAYYAPLQGTWGGKAGEAIGALPFMMAPGANTLAGSAVAGGLLGGAQPTVGDESPLVNTGVGAVGGLLSQVGGNALGKWATNRAAQPFMGWNKGTANRAVAAAAGSDEPALTQSALGALAKRDKAIFDAARSPTVVAPLGGDTALAVNQAAAPLNQSSRNSFAANDDVRDLLTHLRNGSATAEQLGTISSNLGREARSQMTSQMGDRQLGRALFALQDHVDDQVGASITDPSLAAAYKTMLPQYKTRVTLEGRPSLLNSTTGDANMTAIAKYLQKSDKAGFTRGGNTSDYYNAARWGQESGEGKGAPPFSFANAAIPWAWYHARNNPLARGLGGVASRGIAPVSPLIAPAARGLLAPAGISLDEALAQ